MDTKVIFKNQSSKTYLMAFPEFRLSPEGILTELNIRKQNDEEIIESIDVDNYIKIEVNDNEDD